MNDGGTCRNLVSNEWLRIMWDNKNTTKFIHIKVQFYQCRELGELSEPKDLNVLEFELFRIFVSLSKIQRVSSFKQ